ncbi:MAG: S1-like domain-containing RNA-binding protein, partial [Paenibacillus sp.]
MSLVAGTIVSLPIDREVSPYGYFLSAGGQDVLLHYSELTRQVKPGETVEVFLFYDTEDRLAATMKKPYLTLGELALLEVADVHPRLGCFLEMGLG